MQRIEWLWGGKSDFRSCTNPLEGIPKGNKGAAKWYRGELKSVWRLWRKLLKFYCEPSRRATGFWNDGIQVLYDKLSKTRPKMTRSNSWIKLNKAEVWNIEFRVDLLKNATLEWKVELGEGWRWSRKLPKTVYSNRTVQYIWKNRWNYEIIEQMIKM